MTTRESSPLLAQTNLGSAIIAGGSETSNAVRRSPPRGATPQDFLRDRPYDRAMLSAIDGASLDNYHPLLRRLLELWDAKRGNRLMPVRADFDVFELKEWLGNLMLIEVLQGATEFRYRLYGSVLASYYDRDLTGKLTDALAPETRDVVRREYAAVCAARRPMTIERKRSVKHSERMVAKLILPLGGSDGTVQMILVASYPL